MRFRPSDGEHNGPVRVMFWVYVLASVAGVVAYVAIGLAGR